jgi:hypothetical protein
MGNKEKISNPWPYFCAWRGSYILGSGLPPATYWRRWEERIMDHGRTHVKRGSSGSTKKWSRKKNTSLAAPDLVDEERKKKEKKESKVKLKTEQMEKTNSKNGRRKN